MEIEAKFILPDYHTFLRLVEAEVLAGLCLGQVQVKSVHDRYLDTAQAAFLRSGYACRLRAIGDTRIVTLKSLTPASDALHRRVEVEVRLTPAEAAGSIDAWPAAEATELAQRLSAGRPLELLFEMQQERHVRHATRPGEDRPVVEVSVDRVRFDDRGTFQIYELEAELLPAGQVADLEPLVAELIERWELLPQTISKFERGLALCCPQLMAAIAQELERFPG